MRKASTRPCSGTVPLVALLALALPTAPAMAQGLAIYARTPTGLPETLFDTDPGAAAARLAGQCLDEGLSVVAEEAGAVTCRLPDDRDAGARADLGQAGRAGLPIFYRFKVEERGEASRVLASGWEEVAGFWGGTRQRGFEDPVFHNALVDLMVDAGGRLPPGTRFPNHAMIGASFVARARPEHSLEITDVEPDSPAMRAGLQVGDLVTRIANRRTRTLEDLNRSLVDAAGAARFEIRFLREGREGVALLRSEFRPVVTAPVLAEREEPLEKEPAAEEPTTELAAIVAPATPAVAMPAMPAAPTMIQSAAAAAGLMPQSPYAALPYAAAPVMPPQGMPVTYPMPQPYGGVPYAMPQGAILSAAPALIPAPPVQTASPQSPAAGSYSVADELAKFATLLKEGVITQTEFDAQKARLLAQ